MRKLMSIIGTRPQYIKVAMVDKALRASGNFEHIIVDTGQHYDNNMSKDFIWELGIDKNRCFSLPLNDPFHCESSVIGIASIRAGLQRVDDRLNDEMFARENGGCLKDDMVISRSFVRGLDAVLVYGDTNSTFAGALYAIERGTPYFHVEAGLRCGNLDVVEERNRITVDMHSEINFCVNEKALSGRKDVVVGDVTYDAFLAYGGKQSNRHGPSLATIHRRENLSSREKLLSALAQASSACSPFGQIIFPVHPHTRDKIKEYGLKVPDNITTVSPIGYKDTLRILSRAPYCITDSGGLYKDALYSGVSCTVLRGEHEYGWATEASDFGDGHAAEKIVEELERHYDL